MGCFHDGNVFWDDQTTLAGSWEKWCTGRSDNFTTHLFGVDVSDCCKEVKTYIPLQVCTINAYFCPNVCDLIYVSMQIGR